MIASDGWAWIGDTGDASYPLYVYTVGLTATFGHPELVLIGLAPDLARQLIANAVKLIRDGERFIDTQVAERIANVPVVFRTVLEVQRGDHLFVAGFHNQASPCEYHEVRLSVAA